MHIRELQLRTALPPCFLFPVPQQPPQDLPARALRYLSQDLHAALDPLVRRLVLLHVLADGFSNVLVRDGAGLGCLDDEGLGNLSCSLVGDLDDGAVRYVGVREDVRL